MSLSEGGGGWGGTVPQRPVCLSPPQNRNVTVTVREKKKRDGSGGVGERRGCRGGLFVRARTGRTQVIREAEADASGGLGHCRMGETGLDRFRFLPLKLGRVQMNDVKKVQMMNWSDWTWTLRPLNNLDMVH